VTFICLAFFCFSTGAYAANRYWVGGAGNWSDDVNHWATTSGGAPGAGNIPGAADTAIFDANSCTAACTVALDAGVSIGALSLGNANVTIDTSASNWSFETTTASGDTGNFTITAGTFTANGSTITVGGNWDSSGGTFNRGTSTVVMTGAGNTLNGGSFYHLTINSGASITVNSDISGVGTLTITGTLTIASGLIQ